MEKQLLLSPDIMKWKIFLICNMRGHVFFVVFLVNSFFHKQNIIYTLTFASKAYAVEFL